MKASSSWMLHPEEERWRLHVWVFRVLAVCALILGFNYIIWRYTSSLNPDALWFAIPLVLAETYSLGGVALFAFQMWKPTHRKSPPPIEGVTVDVYIATYKEPVDLVHLTADAATRIDWPDLKVYILDDGDRAAMEKMAKELGCGYITRGEEWEGKPRHAKAGNINNALPETSGQFILVLDADQIPAPSIVKACIGYFRDSKMAFVQTPQHFYNVPPGDPYANQTPLFYGPILQGKDGWDAAFFCGSNAILRREALLQLGVKNYVEEMERRVREALSNLRRNLREFEPKTSAQRMALEDLNETLEEAHQDLAQDEPLQSVTNRVHQGIVEAQRALAAQDMTTIAKELDGVAMHGVKEAEEVGDFIREERLSLAEEMTRRLATSPESVGATGEALEKLSLTRSDEAIPVQSMATISVTEDLATSMRLHALGWGSAFHPEVLAYGLAPEDLEAVLEQRRRWAEGTFQVFLRENPLFIEGLSFAQRVQYFTTMYSYFNGFFNLIYLLAPIVYLFTGIAPVAAWSVGLAWRLIPYLTMNQVVFRYVAWGIPVWRGEQYQLSLFPVWIRAFFSVLFGAESQFVVTRKERRAGNYLVLVWPQALIASLTGLAIPYGLFSYVVGWNTRLAGILANIFWSSYNLVRLSASLRAAVYEPPPDWTAKPPEFLFPDGYPLEKAGD